MEVSSHRQIERVARVELTMIGVFAAPMDSFSLGPSAKTLDAQSGLGEVREFGALGNPRGRNFGRSAIGASVPGDESTVVLAFSWAYRVGAIWRVGLELLSQASNGGSFVGTCDDGDGFCCVCLYRRTPAVSKLTSQRCKLSFVSRAR